MDFDEYLTNGMTFDDLAEYGDLLADSISDDNDEYGNEYDY